MSCSVTFMTLRPSPLHGSESPGPVIKAISSIEQTPQSQLQYWPGCRVRFYSAANYPRHMLAIFPALLFSHTLYCAATFERSVCIPSLRLRHLRLYGSVCRWYSCLLTVFETGIVESSLIATYRQTILGHETRQDIKIKGSKLKVNFRVITEREHFMTYRRMGPHCHVASIQLWLCRNPFFRNARAACLTTRN